MKTAFRNWKEWILNYFDDHRITNAFTESFNAKVCRVYRDGRGYTLVRKTGKSHRLASGSENPLPITSGSTF